MLVPLARVERAMPGITPRKKSPFFHASARSTLIPALSGYSPLCLWLFTTSRGQIVSLFSWKARLGRSSAGLGEGDARRPTGSAGWPPPSDYSPALSAISSCRRYTHCTDAVYSILYTDHNSDRGESRVAYTVAVLRRLLIYLHVGELKHEA